MFGAPTTHSTFASSVKYITLADTNGDDVLEVYGGPDHYAFGDINVRAWPSVA